MGGRAMEPAGQQHGARSRMRGHPIGAAGCSALEAGAAQRGHALLHPSWTDAMLLSFCNRQPCQWHLLYPLSFLCMPDCLNLLSGGTQLLPACLPVPCRHFASKPDPLTHVADEIADEVRASGTEPKGPSLPRPACAAVWHTCRRWAALWQPWPPCPALPFCRAALEPGCCASPARAAGPH